MMDIGLEMIRVDEKKVREAIEIIKSNYPTSGYYMLCEALDIAIEALEKQLPKKPKEMKYELLIEYGWKYACPTCGCACGENMYHYDVTKDDMFCTQCGQLLDWSE